jgi:hypothetical protein
MASASAASAVVHDATWALMFLNTPSARFGVSSMTCCAVSSSKSWPFDHLGILWLEDLSHEILAKHPTVFEKGILVLKPSFLSRFML